VNANPRAAVAAASHWRTGDPGGPAGRPGARPGAPQGLGRRSRKSRRRPRGGATEMFSAKNIFVIVYASNTNSPPSPVRVVVHRI